MVSQVQKFQQLGFTAKDIRHVGVHVGPSVEIVGGEVTAAKKIFIGNNEGNFDIDIPTDLIFASMTDNWVFHSFELEGRSWDGIAIFPDDGDFQIRFGEETNSSVIVSDAPANFFAHRYHIVMRNTVTGELVATDPSVKNGDRQNTGG